MGWVYLTALIISLIGMIILDAKYKLFFADDWRRAFVTLIVGVVFFSIWDVAGILFHVFFRGQTVFMTGWQVLPEFPVEELFFLTFLCYLTMNVYGFMMTLRGMLRRRDAAKRGHAGHSAGHSAGGDAA